MECDTVSAIQHSLVLNAEVCLPSSIIDGEGISNNDAVRQVGDRDHLDGGRYGLALIVVE